MLTLHDGNPARVIRSQESFTMVNARPSIIGGIQPKVWQREFAGDNGLFLTDGTIFRFLPVYGGEKIYKLTDECWSETNQERWGNVIDRALKWADAQVKPEEVYTLRLSLSIAAQTKFFDWANDLKEDIYELPEPVRGFVPKLIGYALRLAGILHLFHIFAANGNPDHHQGIDVDGIDRGIETVMFYGGQIIDAMRSLCGDDAVVPIDVDEDTIHLAATLTALEPEVDNGRLAVGHICDKFNEGRNDSEKLSDKRIGGMLREVGLKIPLTRSRANGKVGVFCLEWDSRVIKFLNTVNNVHNVHQVHECSTDGGLE